VYEQDDYGTGRYGQSQAGDGTYGRLASGLGWFSIGLGLAEVAAPGFVASLVGIPDDGRNRTLLRSPLYGMRELAAGAGILLQSNPAPWVWSRVAGDAMDVATLAGALTSDRNDRSKVALGIAAVLGVTMLDVMCARGLDRQGSERAGQRRRPRTTKVISINRSPDEVYAFWRAYENLPRFMRHLESVQSISGNRTRWRVSGPGSTMFEWEAETVEDEPGRRIVWRSVPGSEVHNAGVVTFEPGPGGRGTVVRVEVNDDPPGGAIGKAIAKLVGKDAEQMLDDDLRALKQVLETGEVVNSDASIHRRMHAARPPGANERTLIRPVQEREYA
jgi:uncharacterized membrane protein